MRYLLRVVIVLALVGVAGYLYLSMTAGEFTAIEVVEQNECRQIDGVPGAEDIDLFRQGGVAFISSDDRAATQSGRERTGGIYAWDFDVKAQGEPRLLTAGDPALRPHGISLVEDPLGGATLLVVDHRAQDQGGESSVEHSIRRYTWDGNNLEFVEAHIDDEALISPNDVAGVSDGTFYFTNDHGSRGGIERVMEDYLRVGGGSVVYFDGESFKTVAEGIKYANGIAVDEEEQLVYVASTTTGKIFVYDRDPTTGDLSLNEEIETETGVDNIDLDRHGNLWVAAHPKLLTFVRHAGDALKRSPSEVLWIAKNSLTDPRIQPMWRNEGEELSGSSVAVSVGARIMVGSVFEPHVLVCERAF